MDIPGVDDVHNRQNWFNQQRWWLFIKQAVSLLLSENILKIHLFIYWIICLLTTMEDQKSVNTLGIMIIAMCIVFCILALVTRNACFFYPFLFLVTFEFMTSLALFCIIALKIGWPQNYMAFVKENELDSLQYFAKFTHETSEVSCLWAGFRALYFALVALTLVKNITDYQVDAHHRQHNRYIYPPIPPYPRLVALPEPVMGNTNPDDPPPYSAIIRDLADSGETAKEETLPPCYSECGRSSSNSPSSTSTERSAIRDWKGSRAQSRTIVISKK